MGQNTEGDEVQDGDQQTTVASKDDSESQTKDSAGGDDEDDDEPGTGHLFIWLSPSGGGSSILQLMMLSRLCYPYPFLWVFLMTC